VAALACRVNGSRLYGKPLQQLAPDVTILAQIVSAIRQFSIVDEIVLGISEGTPNLSFVDEAHALACRYIFGDPKDVLSRLVGCGRIAKATDVFRVTTECPFFDYSMLESAWQHHVERHNDITVLDHVPEGAGFEIYTLDALERSHREGLDGDRSEFCSNYARFNQARFAVSLLRPSPECARLDLRLTVDYPEDLIVCRAVYQALASAAPCIPLAEIIRFLDTRTDLKALVAPYVDPHPVWDGQPQREAGA
jgi:spore coat polysaccharide biosynthesis protein SpsF (cytidylyltransferase family)